jgi:5-hydroxyisourate hydrolase
MSGLTTHVLDTANGVPAADMALELYALEGQERTLIKTLRTNADGRGDGPLLTESEARVGRYELVFHAGEYFAKRGAVMPAERFIDIVTLNFGIADTKAHYHVPLLVSPWSYSTYRGS